MARKSRRKLATCSRGHKFYKYPGHTVCPICYPGYYKNKHK